MYELCWPIVFLLCQIFERSKQLASLDKNKLDIAVEEASEQLEIFCQENPQHGPLSLACFIIVALCPLSRRWLFMEHTAQGEGGGSLAYCVACFIIIIIIIINSTFFSF